MDFLVIGLGSMGKRRIRCLKALGYTNIIGFDLREDRRSEAQSKYRIQVYDDIRCALSHQPNPVFIISVPPDRHHIYIEMAVEKQCDFFVEASVTDHKMNEIIEKVKGTSLIAAPSATMCFHPAIKMIKQIIDNGKLGKISNVIFHSGQYLPDWHTYERVSDFYVSNPITGGAREIVPFELTWFVDVFGWPERVCGNYRKTMHIEGAESIDDTYNCLLDYGDFLSVVSVDVVSRKATRRLMINGDKKQLIWDWDDNQVKVFDSQSKKWELIPYSMGQAAAGYHANIGENMYIDELNEFISSVKLRKDFINTLEKDHRVLKLLYAIEASDNHKETAS